MKAYLYCVAFLGLSVLSAPLLAASDHGAAPAHGPAEKPAAAAAAPPPAELESLDPAAQANQPYRLVRTLEEVQDRIAAGSSDAHGFQRQFMAEIADKMLAAGDEVWQRPRNVRSAIVYVLSGGDPKVVKKLAKMESLPGIDPNLIKGVLAYSDGHNAEALKLLTPIDHRAFDTRTGGHLALAKAMVFAPEDAAKSLAFLDDARLLCPGTLVEEAALRRQVLLLGSIGDLPRFEMLAFEYLRRFTHSVYARNFTRSFAVAVASSKIGADPLLRGKLEARLDTLGDEARRSLYMMLAEEGVTRGGVELTRIAVNKIGHLVPAGSREAIRLQLYRAAAQVVTDEYTLALATLTTIDRAKLSRSDQGLLDSALALAAEVRQPPLVSGPITEQPPLSSAAQVRHGDIAGKSQALDTARSALAQAEQLLNREQK
jgi:chemotaxis protein MotC